MRALANKMMQSYRHAEVDSSVASAHPHKLILMLFEGALVAIAKAKVAMHNGEIAPKCEAISKAVSIIGLGLQISLDVKAGGELAENLNALYDYMIHRLVIANLNNQTGPLDEVSGLLTELKSAWEAIDATKTRLAQAVPQSDVSPQRSDSISYGAA